MGRSGVGGSRTATDTSNCAWRGACRHIRLYGLSRRGIFRPATVEEGRKLTREILEARQRLFDRHDPQTSDTMRDLAQIQFEQGQYDEAETLGEEVLQARRLVQGDEHVETLSAMQGLARTYLTQARYDKAEALQRQVLEIRQRVLGEEHSETVSVMYALRVVCFGQRRSPRQNNS